MSEKSEKSRVIRAPIAEAFTGQKVLITGGLGFIGSNLARRLIEQRAEVTIVDSLIPEYGGNLHNIAGIENRVRVNISDVRDEHSLRYLVQGQNFLFNLAGQTSHLDSMHEPFADLEINCRAQLSILETCRKFNPEIKVVFASTRQLYGKPEYLPVDEKHLLRPVDVNGINKMAGEWYHILYNSVYHVRACALRLSNTYGPCMRIKDARQTFLGVWIRLILQGQPFEVWEGEQLRDFTYVDDAVDALLQCAASEQTAGQIFNLGGEKPYRLLEVADSLVKANGGGKFAVKSFPPERKRIDIGDYYCDWGRIHKATGWQPRVYLPEGLERTLAYYQKNLERYL